MTNETEPFLFADMADKDKLTIAGTPNYTIFNVNPQPGPVLVIKPNGVMYVGTSDKKVDDATREELLALVHSLVGVMTGKGQ